MDVKPTVEVIRQMAQEMRRAALEMERTAEKIEETGEIDRAADAMMCIRGLYGNLRTDLLITRPIRAIEVKS